MTGVRLENKHHADWGNVVVNDKEKEHRFPYYIPTGEVFNHDPDSLIRLKCLALVGATPVISIARSIYWLSTSIFAIFSQIYLYLDGQNCSQKKIIYEKAHDSVRALGYGTLMTASAFKGIFNPYQERWRYGHLERRLNRHPDGPHRDKFYLAFCCQRICVLSKEDQNHEQVMAKLTKYLARIDAVLDAIKKRALRQLLIELQGLRQAKT